MNTEERLADWREEQKRIKPRKIKPLYLYLIGIAINAVPVLISYIIAFDGGGEMAAYRLWFYFRSFFFLIFLYCIYFLLIEKRIFEHKIIRPIILFFPFLLSIVLIFSFYFNLKYSGNIGYWFLESSPFLIITISYALYLEITIRNRLKQIDNIK
jgi:hypothetical protein